MEKLIGKIREVFIPNNRDVMNSKKIGFKVLVDNEIIEIIEEQNAINAKILREDKVIVKKQNINGIDYIAIEKYDGE